MFQVFSNQNRVWESLIKKTDGIIGYNITVTKMIFPFLCHSKVPVRLQQPQETRVQIFSCHCFIIKHFLQYARCFMEHKDQFLHRRKSLFKDDIGHIVITPTGTICLTKRVLNTKKRIQQGMFSFCCNASPIPSPITLSGQTSTNPDLELIRFSRSKYDKTSLFKRIFENQGSLCGFFLEQANCNPALSPWSHFVFIPE